MNLTNIERTIKINNNKWMKLNKEIMDLFKNIKKLNCNRSRDVIKRDMEISNV
jgi:cell division protein FtsB